MERRGFIKIAAVSTGTVLLLPTVFPGCSLEDSGLARSVETDAMDEALEMMSSLAPLGNHGPMAVEALISLGRPERMVRFVESYKRRFTARYPNALRPITEKTWNEALGDGSRNKDWVNFFDRQFMENGWKEVVNKWTGILSAGLSAAAGHGVIRTCHAARSLSQKRTDLRLRELAEGLGYWASYFQPLPERRDPAVAKMKPLKAIDRVPILPLEKRRRGSIMDQLRALDDFQPFAGTIGLADTSGDAGHVVSALTEALAEVYLKNVSDQNNLILLHALTATAGLRSLLPYLSEPTTSKALLYGWQTAAGLYSIGATGVVNRTVESKELAREDLIERAVATNEEHAIKFTEACLREYALNPKQVYLRAANDSLNRLPSFS